MKKKSSFNNIFQKTSASVIAITGLLVFLFSANNLSLTGAVVGTNNISQNIIIIIWGLLITASGIWMWFKKDPTIG